jgi:hypothetical protein
MGTVSALIFALVVAGCGRHSVAPFDRELDMMARMVEAKGCVDKLRVARPQRVRHDDLAPQTHGGTFDVEQCGERWQVHIRCVETTEQLDGVAGPRCVAYDSPELQVRAASRLAPELVAVFAHLRGRTSCEFYIEPFELLRSTRPGSSSTLYTVSACGRTARLRAECSVRGGECQVFDE